jgi:hypothetical protein
VDGLRGHRGAGQDVKVPELGDQVHRRSVSSLTPSKSAADFVNRLHGLASDPALAVVVAARPREEATSGAFSRAFADAVRHRASGGHKLEFLPLDGVVSIGSDTTPGGQHARLFRTGDGITEFLPNPRLDRWLRDLDLRTQALRRHREARQAEQRDHAVIPDGAGWPTTSPIPSCSLSWSVLTYEQPGMTRI